jgi:hypothetical protein
MGHYLTQPEEIEYIFKSMSISDDETDPSNHDGSQSEWNNLNARRDNFSRTTQSVSTM